MDYLLDCALEQEDAAFVANEKLYGWDKAEMGEAWTVNGGIGIMEDGAVRVANSNEAAGVRRHWREMGYTR